jgi:hypothetical protein
VNVERLLPIADERLDLAGYTRLSSAVENRDGVAFLIYLRSPNEFPRIDRYMAICGLPDESLEVLFGGDNGTRFAPWASAGVRPPDSTPEALTELIDHALTRAEELTENHLTGAYPTVVRQKVMVARA